MEIISHENSTLFLIKERVRSLSQPQATHVSSQHLGGRERRVTEV